MSWAVEAACKAETFARSPERDAAGCMGMILHRLAYEEWTTERPDDGRMIQGEASRRMEDGWPVDVSPVNIPREVHSR